MDATVDAYIEVEEGIFTVSMSNGKCFTGFITGSDGNYAIELMDPSSSDYTAIESAYDCQADEFVQILNYLLRTKGTTVATIIPMVGGYYSVADSAGTTYMLAATCSPALIMIGMLES